MKKSVYVFIIGALFGITVTHPTVRNFVKKIKAVCSDVINEAKEPQYGDDGFFDDDEIWRDDAEGCPDEIETPYTNIHDEN